MMRIQALVEKAAQLVCGRRRKKEMPASVLIEPTRFPYGPFRFRFRTLKRFDCTILASTDLLNWDIIAAHQTTSDSEETENGRLLLRS